MKELRELPLGELETRVRAARGVAGLRRLAEALCTDRRAGARALGRRCERLAEDARVERRRLRRLFARRARLRRDGARVVAGVDEVGMGPLAGPVIAAAVVLADRVDLPGLDDSKRLRPKLREELAGAIRSQAVAHAIGRVDVDEIDRLNIYRAGQEAMRRALAGLGLGLDHVLVDGRPVPGLVAPQTAIVGGDASDGVIAAASILAKVHRDDLMQGFDRHHPGYGFATHKGYATRSHLAALRRLGPSPIHRWSFAPVRQQRLL